MSKRPALITKHLFTSLLSHWPQKLTAFVIAIFLWLFVTTEQITTSQRSFLVPLTIIGLTNNQLATGVPDLVEVSVAGESNRIDALRAENIEAILDLSNVASDFARPVRVSPPQGITLLRRDPSEVIGTVETRARRIIAVTPSFLRTRNPEEPAADVAPPPDTPTAGSPEALADTPTSTLTGTPDTSTNNNSSDSASPTEAAEAVTAAPQTSSPLFHNLQYQVLSEPAEVAVTGRSGLVDEVVRVIAPINLEQRLGLVTPEGQDEASPAVPLPLPEIAPFEVQLYASDLAGNPVTGLVLEPDRVQVQLTATPILHTKRLPLEVILPTLSDFVVESRQLSQTNVLVAGSYDLLQGLEGVVASVDMSQQPPREGELSMAVSLQLPEGIMALETPMLRLRLSRIRDFPFTTTNP
ncbi:MAG: CdaR family protein [Deinococcota bacterium]